MDIFRQGLTLSSLSTENKPCPNINAMFHRRRHEVTLFLSSFFSPPFFFPEGWLHQDCSVTIWAYPPPPSLPLHCPFTVVWINVKQESRLGVGMGACQSILGRAPKNIFVEWGRERKWPGVWREARLRKLGEARVRDTEWGGKLSHWVKLSWMGEWEGCYCVSTDSSLTKSR